MAQKTSIFLVDDLDGSEAEETVEFGLDGANYQIDLNPKNAGKLREVLRRYVGAARELNGRRPSARPKAKAIRVDKEQNHVIREWARKRGHTLSDRGRIPTHIVEAFAVAHAK